MVVANNDFVRPGMGSSAPIDVLSAEVEEMELEEAQQARAQSSGYQQRVRRPPRTGAAAACLLAALFTRVLPLPPVVARSPQRKSA
jgi:hypothetical protein